MKTHLLNRCKKCGSTWFPRGFDLSRKCPNCGSVEVDFTGRFYLMLLVLAALAAGIFWAKDRSHRAAHNKTTTPAPIVSTKLQRPAQVTPIAPFVPAQITTEAEGRREALRLYPDLGIENSALNREFVVRYRSYQRLQPEFFQDPGWPVILVKECAAMMAEREKAE